LAELNPYKILRVRRDADAAEIEAAYNAQFDRFEGPANEGDEDAIRRLEELNEAHDVLLDPRRRARVDAQLGSARREMAAAGASASGAAVGAKGRQGYPGQSRGSRQSGGRQQTARSYGGRARTVEAPRTLPVLPLVAAGIFLVGVALLAAFLLARGAGASPCPPQGNVVASVNGVPIYEREWNERIERDKQNAASDPLIAGFLQNNFQGITGTRMLDVIKQDALDKLINMEVIQQEARTEGNYPSEQDQVALINQTKAAELQGRSFEQFLSERGICEEQYNASVVRNAVYLTMANDHLPAEGNDDARTTGFINWICQTRQKYDVQILVDFMVKENQPCSSGLPTDLPITAGQTQEPPAEVPEAVPTGEGPMVPRATP
jgi:hypothetical protein